MGGLPSPRDRLEACSPRSAGIGSFLSRGVFGGVGRDRKNDRARAEHVQHV